MIIDIHGHVSAPQGLYAYKSGLLAARGSHGKAGGRYSDEQVEAALNARSVFGDSHMEQLRKHGTDVQLLSPRPFQLMHSERPAKIVQWFHEAFHEVIAQNVKLHPTMFRGVAGLPQVAGLPIEVALPELERCVKDLGFVGCLLNPDPYENSGTEPPALSDRYWYPLYEKLCELDVPAMIHTASSKSERTPYSLHFINEETIAVLSLCNSDVFKDFPSLKIIMAHPGWPWVEETTAVALHKGNVYWEMSGWAPRHFPGNLKTDIRGRLQDKIMFGSDYPSLPYERIFREWSELGYSDAVMEKVMHGNAERVLGL